MNSTRFAPSRAAAFLSTRADSGDETPEIDLLRLLRTLWRGKWLILLIVLAAVGATAVYAWRIAVPLYTATSVVSLQNREEQVVDLGSVVSGIGSDDASVKTEVEVLRSRGLIDALVDRLDLQDDPEFNAYLRPYDPYSVEALRALLPGAAAPEAPPSPRVVREETVSAVLDALAISNVRDTYVFNIAARTQEPEKSALIADELAELYIRDQLEAKFEANEQATEWLTDRVSQLKVELDKAERAAQSFHSQIELISPERLEQLNWQLKEFRGRHAELSAERAQREQVVAELEAAAASGDDARMAEAAGISPPAQAGGREAFRRRFEQVLERARAEARRAGTQAEAVAGTITDLERQVAEQSTQALELEQLRREAEASRLIYEYFLSRLKETSVQQGIQQADARVLSNAMLPTSPSSPRKGLLLGLALLVSLPAGGLLVILREMRSNAFRTAEEMELETGTTVIGQIPRGPRSSRRRLLDYIATKPTSALVEAVRNLRTSILLSAIDRAPKVIMMTSSMPGEGKTTLSLALAQNLAGMGRKVLLIDGDIRRRTLRELFDVKDRRGLLTAILDNAPLEEILHHDEKIGCDVLLSERATINAADLFSSDRFAAFIERVRGAYDFVVIDTPPVLMVPDARVIAQSSDAVVYVVRWDRTPRQQVMQGLQAFATVNAPVTGLVLSQIDPRGMKRYGYSGVYGEGYGSSSKKYHDD